MYERRAKEKNCRQAEKPETIIFKTHLSGRYSEFGFQLVFNSVTHSRATSGFSAPWCSPLQILAPKSASSLQRLQPCIPHSSQCVLSLLLFLWFVIFKALTPFPASSHVLLSWVSWQTLSKDIFSPRTRPGGQTKYVSGSGQNINSDGNICYATWKRGEPVKPKDKACLQLLWDRQEMKYVFISMV